MQIYQFQKRRCSRAIDVIKFASLCMSQMTHLNCGFGTRNQKHTLWARKTTRPLCCVDAVGGRLVHVETKQSPVCAFEYFCKGTRELLLLLPRRQWRAGSAKQWLMARTMVLYLPWLIILICDLIKHRTRWPRIWRLWICFCHRTQSQTKRYVMCDV